MIPKFRAAIADARWRSGWRDRVPELKTAFLAVNKVLLGFALRSYRTRGKAGRGFSLKLISDS